MEAAKPPPSRQERERERLRQVAARRKEQRWLNPSAASLEREHEFMAWLEMRPQQHGDEPRNDTFEIFLAERRKAKETERMRQVAERRRIERQQRRIRSHISRGTSRVRGGGMGFGRCGGATSMRVRLEALCLLLQHGVWVREPLSIRVLCERVPCVWEPLLARVRQLV